MSKTTRFIVAAGSVLALASAFGIGVWYGSRPSQRGWAKDALLPTFRAAQLEGDAGRQSPVLFFQLENTTDDDYEIRDVSEVELFVREKGALDSWMGSGAGLTIDLPLVVPAKQKANVTIHLKFVELERPASDSQADVQAFLKASTRVWNRHESIVLLDKRKRYQVDFPMMR